MAIRPGPAVRPEASLLTRDFVAICIGSMLFLASLFLTVPILPLYVESVGGSPGDVGLVVGAFTLTALVLRLVVGRWLDQGWARKRLLFAGVIVFLIATAFYPIARHVVALLILRFFHGSGMASYGTTSTTLIADSVPPARLGEAMGYYGMASTFGMAIAPAAGVAILGLADFTAVFAVSAGLVLITGATGLVIREPARRAVKHVAWRNLFNRRAWLPFVLAISASLSFSVIITFLPLLVQHRQVGNAGLYFTVYSTVVLLVRVFAGRLSDRAGRGIAIVPGLALMSVALALLALTESAIAFWVSAIVFGAGFGATSPALSALAVEVVPPDQRGSAIATYTSGFEFGIGFGSIALGPIVQAAGFVVTFLIAAIGPAAGAAIYLIARRSRAG